MIHTYFLPHPIWSNGLLFCIAAAAIWFSGVRLTHYADAISDRLRIGKALMGLVFLAAATSLPELVTTITAAIEGNASLVLNNMFGGITMQTAILSVADITVAQAALTFYPRKSTPVLEGVLLCLLLAMLFAITFLGDINLFWNIGLGSVLISLAYWMAIGVLREYEISSAWRPLEVAEVETTSLGLQVGRALDKVQLRNLLGLFAGTSLIVLGAGILLVSLAEAIAQQTGLGSSFVGVTLLAGSTSLPELSTTISAVRIGAYTMAISNILGSNLIMLALLLPADLFYRQGVLLQNIDRLASFAIVSGIIVTAVYVCGLILRKKKCVFRMGVDSLVVLVLYLTSIIVFYQLR